MYPYTLYFRLVCRLFMQRLSEGVEIGLDLGAESGDGGGAVVVDEIVGMGDVHGSLLRAYARAHLINVYVVAGNGALNTQFLGGGDGDDLVAKTVQATLEKDGTFDKTEGLVGVVLDLHARPLLHIKGNGGVDDAVEPLEEVGVMKDLLGDQFGVIDVAIKHLAAEQEFDLRTHHGIGDDNLLGAAVGVVGRIAEVAQSCRDGALAAPDTSCKSDEHN